VTQQQEHVFPYYRSPEDIRRQEFNHRMRGLDEYEVQEFLGLLADQVKATELERAEFHAENERLRAEVESLRSKGSEPEGGVSPQAVLLFSQAATTRALMPLGISLGLPHSTLIASWPAVNGYFFLPTYGTIIAAINFDRSGTTRIGRFVLNHSFMLPGLVATVTAVAVGFVIGKFLL